MSLASDSSEQTPDADAQGSARAAGLYAALEIDRGATAAEIKRAYRRLALRHHPDRNRGAPAVSADEFVRIQYAYDVLTDERLRRIYNRYGEMGVQMADRVGGELLDPLVSGVLSVFAFATAAAALLLIAFFALLARRVDHANSWPFAVTFAPLWVVDLAALAAVALAAARSLFGAGGSGDNGTAPSDTGSPDASPHGSEDEAEPGSDASAAWPPPAPTDETPLLGTPRRKRQRRRHRVRAVRRLAEACLGQVAAFVPVAYMLLLIAFQVMLVARLDGHAAWTALQVAAPWFCIEAIHFVLLTLQLLAGLQPIRDQPVVAAVQQAAVLAADMYWWLAIRVALGLLVVAKVSGALESWNWALVLVPAYLPAVRWAVALCLLGRQLRAPGGDADMRQNAGAIVVVCAVAFGMVTAFVYSFVALLVWKLEQPLAVRLALVFVPVFVAL
ncbi:hypothetical protein IWQ57_005830, partial [Coemansia nantahalensis]